MVGENKATVEGEGEGGEREGGSSATQVASCNGVLELIRTTRISG